MIQSNPLDCFDIRKKSSIYTLTIMIPSTSYRMSIFELTLSATKPRSIRNTMSYWFHNLIDCLNLYILCNRHATSSSLIALKDFIFGGNFIKINRSLYVGRLLKHIFTIFTWSPDNSNSQKIARNMHSDCILTIREKVSIKSIPYFYKVFCTISFALYRVTNSLR